eukprot:MONOS_12642.1-p1 / transcript=MONOS_12642.1 / gene=MONOS_12642 / organism=Monocercomonoides_exilis_PA203 / gene_product=heat shock protein Hsp90, cytosolic protein / transcript_product=heat shock protein Hsp90, cytosolic protein / location=Mono_scaffold00713:17573-20123(-) / protein_length=833 / sequence_SO=supercontig / SO=protein_coding / is_pseudo=false
MLGMVMSEGSEVKESSDVTSIEFSADISRLMKLIVNSLYSNKEIFLRELISNCADALNKVKIESQVNPEVLGEGDMAKLEITVIPDEDEETLTIIDTGIGMDKDELIQNLGTVAHSGTFKFFEAVANGTMDADLIGQFGVGFYSSYLVADKVVVTSKRHNSTQNIWTSTGTSSFTVEEDTKGENLHRGTKVKLFLKEKEIQYANTTRVRDIIMKYSQFIDFPIFLRVEQEDKNYRSASDDDEDNPEPDLEYVEPVYEYEHVNLEPAIWLRDPNEEIADGDYIAFFHTIAPEFAEDPRIWTHFHQTIDCDFKSILFIPGSIPKLGFAANDRRFTHIRLYIHRVLITEQLENFLPRYLNFVRGVVDSEDLPLNVSREMLQETKAMRMIARKIVRKIIQMMNEIAERSKDSEEDEDPYLTFYRDFGSQIKIGCIEDHDNRKKLAKLLRFNTTEHEEYPISLDDYIANMKPDQKYIYYIAGDPTVTTITKSPFLIPLKKKGYEVLFFPETIDEAMAKEMRTYDGRPFESITQSNSNKAESDKEKQRLKEWKKEFRPLTNWFKKLLKSNVTRVEISTRLAVDTTSPCVLSSAEGSVSPQLAEMIRAQEERLNQKAQYEEKKVLELNPRSDLIKRMNYALQTAKDKRDQEKLEKLGRMMFETAMLDNGYHIEDATVYADHVFEIMTKMTGLPHAPVMPDDFMFDFEKMRQQEEEEELAALRAEKAEKRRKLREEKRRLAREAGLSEDSIDESEFAEDKPLDEQEELFQELEKGVGPTKADEEYFKELHVEDIDDKRDRELAERKAKREKRRRQMEKDRKRKEEEAKRKRRGRGDDDDDD